MKFSGFANRYEQVGADWFYKTCQDKKLKCTVANCQQCGDEFVFYVKGSGKFCSRDCSGASKKGKSLLCMRGENHPAWKGGEIETNEPKIEKKRRAKRETASSPFVVRHQSVLLFSGRNPNRYAFEDGEWWYYYGRNLQRSRCKKRKCAWCGSWFLTPGLNGGISECCRPSHSTKWTIYRQQNGVDRPKAKEKREQTGVIPSKRGYVLVLSPDHPSCKRTRTQKYVRRNRLVMEKHLGRYLVEGEEVHHINGVRNDDRIENLELWKKSHPSGRRASDSEMIVRNWEKEFSLEISDEARQKMVEVLSGF